MGHDGPAPKNLNITRERAQQKRNFLTTLLLSQGVPMLLAGDEFGRTQNGNNNAYCQDNEISWVNWEFDSHGKALLEFVRRLVQLRKRHPVFHRRHFFQGRRIMGANVKDIFWLRPDGEEMTDREWQLHHTRCLGLLLHGEAIEEHDERGRKLRDDTFLLCLNADSGSIAFRMPALMGIARWGVEIDTCYADGRRPDRRTFNTGESYLLQGRSTALLRLMRSPR
jgi:glycogen operon protein